jgi:phosphoribosyl 1,2-cyclic phosphodiesterase
MGFYVTFWGVRGSIPTPGHFTQRYGGNTACIEVRIQDQLFILDGGSGLRPLGADILDRGQGAIHAHMLFSHSHWDHIQGFPFFPPAYNPNTTLRVYGTKEGDRDVFDLLSGQMQDKYFPVQFSDLGAKIIPDNLNGGKKKIGDVIVDYHDTCHPGGSLAYSLSHESKKVIYSTDNELDLLLLNKDETFDDPKCFRKVPRDMLKFMQNADLLVADGQYTEAEYTSKINWGHPRATTLVDMAFEANIKALAITHHDPMQSDDAVDKKITECRTRAERIGYTGMIFAAREGVTLKI